VYVVVVALVVAAHCLFLGYLVTGGFLALRWPRSVMLHVPVVLWGVGSVVLHWPCPLTWLERWARARVGMEPLPSEGFIAHYISGVLYPVDTGGVVVIVVGVGVAVSWLALAGRWLAACRRV